MPPLIPPFGFTCVPHHVDCSKVHGRFICQRLIAGLKELELVVITNPRVRPNIRLSLMLLWLNPVTRLKLSALGNRVLVGQERVLSLRVKKPGGNLLRHGMEKILLKVKCLLLTGQIKLNGRRLICLKVSDTERRSR